MIYKIKIEITEKTVDEIAERLQKIALMIVMGKDCGPDWKLMEEDDRSD